MAFPDIELRDNGAGTFDIAFGAVAAAVTPPVPTIVNQAVQRAASWCIAAIFTGTVAAGNVITVLASVVRR